MKAAGYEYINIDDCWQGQRDGAGNIRPNSKFPDMKALAEYVHSKGLNIGIYSSPGPKTCGGYEGSYGHEEQDARTYAMWEIDFLKYDLCSLEGKGDQIAAYRKMGQALKKNRTPNRIQFVPVRHGGSLEVGSRRRRQLVAYNRRYPR